MPSKTTTCGCEVKGITIIHEVVEEGSSIVIKDSPSLVTTKKSFIEVTNSHPRVIDSVTDVCEVSPKVWAHSVVRASIDTSTCNGSISTVEGEGYRVLVASLS